MLSILKKLRTLKFCLNRYKFAALLVIFILLISIQSLTTSASELKVTEEHPFLINNAWIPASQLQVGDELTTIDGKKVIITEIEDVETKNPFLVYNLEAGIYHDFIVSDLTGSSEQVGIVVHNSNVRNSQQLFKEEWTIIKRFEGGSSGALLIKSSDGTLYAFKPIGPRCNPYAEVIASDLDNFLGLDLVPSSRIKSVRGQTGALIDYVDGVWPNPTEFLNSPSGKKSKFFDYLTWNFDRSRSIDGVRLQNVLKEGDNFKLIDNAEGFGVSYNGQAPLPSQLPPQELKSSVLTKLKQLRGNPTIDGYDYSLLEEKYSTLFEQFPLSESDKEYVLTGFKERIRLMIEALEH
jgi:hypothetical protein